MANNIVRRLGAAGCTAEVYVPFDEDGISSTGLADGPRVFVIDRNGLPTDTARMGCEIYIVLAP